MITKKVQMGLLVVFWWLLFSKFSSDFVDYKKFVWFVWAGNFASSSVIIIFSFIAYLGKGIVSKIDGKKMFSLAFALIPLLFVHAIIGAFLSFFAQTDPMDKFGPNGYINHFQWYDGLQLLYEYFPLFYPYFATKITFFGESNSAKIQGGMYSRDAVLVLLAAIAFPLLGLSLQKNDINIDLSKFSFLCISIFIFIPWQWFFSKDIGAKAIDKEAAIDVNFSFPLIVKEQNYKGWGIFIFIFGLVFVLVGIGSFAKLFLGGEQGFIGLIFGTMFFIAFAGFGALAMIIGLNFQWGYRHITISNEVVKCEQKVYLPIPFFTHWSLMLSDYKMPEKIIKQNRGDGTSYTEYSIVLKLKNKDFKKPTSLKDWLVVNKDVVLYKSYHEEDLDKKFQQAKDFFAKYLDEKS